jgi:hypothetical protein
MKAVQHSIPTLGNYLLQPLDLSGNKIGSSGAVTPRSRPSALSALQSLTWNSFGDDGVAGLGPHFAAISSLQCLALRVNYIDFKCPEGPSQHTFKHSRICILTFSHIHAHDVHVINHRVVHSLPGVPILWNH